jgi:syntaxin-binding protein 5
MVGMQSNAGSVARWVLIRISVGDIVAYDLDREALSAFRIPNLLREVSPRAKLLPVVSMHFHPRDIGTLLVGYTEGAALFSFKQNKPTKFFQYEVPRGAPGGDPDLAGPHEVRRPRLSHAIWHPTGTFILTAHDDSSLVFWDPRDGRTVEARTIQTTSIQLPGGGASTTGSSTGVRSMKQPYYEIFWCSKENPDDTGLLIAGGTPTSNPTPGLTFFDLGQTPNYQTSSWDVLAKHFQNPKRTHILPTPPNAEVVKFLPIPRSSPHYAGSHDPIAVITLLSSGELITLSFPSGHPITPTNQLHVSLSFVHPFVTKTALACVDRMRWLGIRESRQHGPNFLLGGVDETRPLKRHENRNIIQTAHADGTIRVWDAGHGDEIENGVVLQVDLARAVGRFENIDVTQMSMSGATAELSVGLRSGEVVVFRLNTNQHAGREPAPSKPNALPGRLISIVERADPALKEGLLPLTLLNEQQGPITALKHSDVGFVAVGFEASIAVIDLRGPAIIHTQVLSGLALKSKRASSRRSNSQMPGRGELPTVMEFGVMTLDGDGELSSSRSPKQLTRSRLFLNLPIRWHFLRPSSNIQDPPRK